MTEYAAGNARRPVGEIVDKLNDAVPEGDVTVGELLKSLGESSLVTVLFVPALLVVSPLSGIPLFSSVCGLLIAVISAQVLFGRKHLSLPGFIMRRSISGDRARAALRRVRGMTDWLDTHTRTRWRFVLRSPMRQWIYVLCLLCGAVMPFLELVPFSSSILGSAVLLFATALIAGDGLLAGLGIGVMTAAAVTTLYLFDVL
ncbi:exopolysaccharide biosynthesis protein [Salipiger sp.]|uniref:exopolysaccharide biosynthesis protein n=1 Tax=Salipiger sp. TaxID=2078585 RepID=UPI003A97AD49